MDLGLEGKRALVTGASKGIGRAIAEALAAEGCRVVINARNEEELEATAERIKSSGGEVYTVAADISDAGGTERLFKESESHLGGIDVLVNNAGSIGRPASFDELSDEEWEGLFELNVMSAVRLSRAVLPGMRQRGWGRIINVGSESGLQPDPFMPHYNATKAALTNLTKSLSKAYGAEGILVNTVSPATIRTPLVESMFEGMAEEQGVSKDEAEKQFLRQSRPHIVLGRPGEPEEAAKAVVFLASEAASFITGSDYRVDGGSVAHM